jgi:hypothetical protein
VTVFFLALFGFVIFGIAVAIWTLQAFFWITVLTARALFALVAGFGSLVMGRRVRV